MHLEPATFVNEFSELFDAAEVVEVGSLNVNGQVRDFLDHQPASWLGVDLVPGNGVDIVGDAIDALPCLGRTFDVAVATEVLEHHPRWRDVVAAMVDAVHPGGHVVLTCASMGRAPHSASGAPLPLPGEHYANVTEAEFAEFVAGLPVDVVTLRYLPSPGDLQAVLRRR